MRLGAGAGNNLIRLGQEVDTAMKAMILAAGFGTRLLPYTLSKPKPLFTIAGRPLLDLTIRQLQTAGCRAIVINTHHLRDQIEAFIARQTYSIPVHLRFEPQILGTGGAVKNVADFWDDEPFMIINSDIVTDIDLKKVYRFHRQHSLPATLVLHDEPKFNSVSVDSAGRITAFGSAASAHRPEERLLAFTGIQVLDPIVLESIPEGVFYSSIDAYRRLIAAGRGVKAFISTGHYWADTGTPESYRQAVMERMTPQAFARCCPSRRNETIQPPVLLAGDGSDRRWYRLQSESSSLILVDHGIRQGPRPTEVDAFVAIGRHLQAAGVCVPRIYLYDRFSGLVYLQDVGDRHLQEEVLNAKRSEDVRASYRLVVRQLLKMFRDGTRHFDPAWAYQTPTYSRELILEKECRYFADAFLDTYLGLQIPAAELKDEFSLLADRALEFGVEGFMHRDFQSRNIMVQNGTCYFIDFQGGRLGPLQYDLASLLIDPYVELPEALQTELLEYAIKQAEIFSLGNPERFRRGYHYCCLTRNLQILGAFGYLSKVKGKSGFAAYIPSAAKGLYQRLEADAGREFPRLKAVAAEALRRLK